MPLLGCVSHKYRCLHDTNIDVLMECSVLYACTVRKSSLVLGKMNYLQEMQGFCLFVCFLQF
jgi:hypothetical protein